MKFTKQLCLRKVCCQDEQNRYYEFLTNSFEKQKPNALFMGYTEEKLPT
jgi:hypothetical protein